MKWTEFERKVKKRGVFLFNLYDVQNILRTSRIATRFLIYRWRKKGLIITLKRGLYQFADVQVPDPYIANKLYEPSYVSLEYALSYHRVIPEAVYAITSVSPRATRKFIRQEKQYLYRHIKKNAFTGYAPTRLRGFVVNIADPEKAFVDLLYLRLIKHKPPISRFAKDRLNRDRMVRYAKLFNNTKLLGIVMTIVE